MDKATPYDYEAYGRKKWNRPLAWLNFGVLAIALGPVPASASHPGLWYVASDLQQLRDRKTGTHAPIYDPLRQGTEYFLGSTISPSGRVSWPGTGRILDLGDRRDIGNSLVVFAFVSDLADDVTYFALARTWLLAVANFGGFDLDGTHDLVQAHLLAGVAIAYDILAPSLSFAERQVVLSALSRNANELMNAGRGGIWWEWEFLQNHNWINHAAVGLTALATLEDLPSSSTTPWLDYAVENAQNVKASLDSISDGTWHEGFSYAAYGLTWHLPFVAALQRLTGLELGDIGMVRAHGSTRAHVQLPNAANQHILVHGDFYGFSTDEDLVVLRYAASRLLDGIAQGVADAWVTSVTPSTYAPEMAQRVFEYLFYEPAVASVNLRTLPLDWFGADQQAAVFRSGWEASDLVFALKSGAFGGTSALNRIVNNQPPYGGLNFAHDHADDNGFYLYGNGTWLAPEAAGYYIGHPESPGPQANRAVFHNSLLVDGNGQLGEGVRTNGDEHFVYSWFTQRSGRISAFGSTDHFAYTVGEGAQLYPSSLGLSGWSRHVLFLDRKWIVLRDVIQSSQSHIYSWLCHLMEGVAREGSWLHGYERNGQALGVAILSPTEWQLAVEPQSPVNISRLNPSGSVFAAKVANTASSRDMTFLTALVPISEAAWDNRPSITALDPVQPEAGLWLSDGPRIAAALFNDLPTGSRNISGLQLDGLTGVVEYLNGIPSRVLLVRGTRISDSYRLVASQAAPTEILEADGLAGETVSISGDLSQQFRIYAPAALHLLRSGVEIPFSREAEYIVVPSQDSPREHGVDAGTPPNPGPIGTAGSSTTAPAALQASATGCSVRGLSHSPASWLVLAMAAALARSIARAHLRRRRMATAQYAVEVCGLSSRSSSRLAKTLKGG